MTSPHPTLTAAHSSAELLLAVQLEQAGIPFEREYRFASPRRWRSDFHVWSPSLQPSPLRGTDILVEIEGGSYTGGHKRGRAYESDVDKHNDAIRRGWRVYRFTPAHVDDGRAIAFIRAVLDPISILKESEQEAVR
jgi:hypothetical protein